MDVHSPKNGINRYWSIAIWTWWVQLPSFQTLVCHCRISTGNMFREISTVSSQENHNFLVKSPIFPHKNPHFSQVPSEISLFFPGEQRRLFLRPSSRAEAQDPGQRGPGEEPETQRAAGDTCNAKMFPWRINDGYNMLYSYSSPIIVIIWWML